MKVTFITALLILYSSVVSYTQTLPTLKPSIGTPNNYSKQQQQQWILMQKMYKEVNAGKLTYDKLSVADRAVIDSLEAGGGPITDMGCSWYCGGQMYKVTADSHLKGEDKLTYKPDNIHDFDLMTAWIPDTLGGVIGKKISFYFKPLSPRVNEIMIYNGYIKNYNLFKANARVKKFKMYINDKAYAVLEIADTTAQQSFSIEALQSKNPKKDLVITLEIMEVYKGDKYPDVAVSEINFGGIDVH